VPGRIVKDLGRRELDSEQPPRHSVIRYGGSSDEVEILDVNSRGGLH
jgi:hypothetical protein